MSVVTNPGNSATIHRYAAFTHRGKPFARNQDAILVAGQVLQQAEFVDGQAPFEQMPRFAISDGVSANPRAAVASRLVLQALLALDAIHPGLSPRARVELLQDRLPRALNRERRLEDAAATLITVERSGDGFRLWHAGDSRGYRITRGQALRLTQDHTVVNVLRAEGVLSAGDEHALGGSGLAHALDSIFVYSHYAEPPTASAQSVPLPPGDVLLLISDGVTAELSDGEIVACIDAADPPGNAQRLFDAVMAKGASDDLSAIVLTRDPTAT